MYEDNSQGLFYTFLDFCSSQEHTLMFQYFLELLNDLFVDSYIYEELILIDKVIFLIACVHIFL